MPESQVFVLFYRAYRSYIHALCVARCRTLADVAEAESAIWYDIHRSFEKFQIDDPRTRLYRLAVWRIRNIYRSGAKKYETEVEDERLLQLLEQHLSKTHTADHRMALQQALAQESELDRALVFGRYVEEMTWEELAARHQLHRNTVSKRTEDCLQRLQKQLTDF